MRPGAEFVLDGIAIGEDGSEAVELVCHGFPSYQDWHHRGMASAIDDWPVGVPVSLKRGWRSPLEAYTLCLGW